MGVDAPYRVVIIGAGPAGCACAMALLNAGFRDVVLIDHAKTHKFHIGESIPPDLNPLMRQLGIYQAFFAEGHEPCYGSCSYWGSPLRGYNDSILSPYGHGWHLDRAKFNVFLQRQASARGAVVLGGFVYQHARQTEAGYNLQVRSDLGDTRVLPADFVVDASGARSVFATERGRAKIHSKPLVCLALRFKNQAQHEVSKLTHLEAVEEGWWYAASIPGEQLLATFYTTAEVAKELALNQWANWMALLQKSPHTQSWLAGMEPSDHKLLGFSAPCFCLTDPTGPHWLAIGDAAAAFDPITAQGIIKGMTQGMRAAEIIAHYSQGAPGALAQYATEVANQYTQYLAARQYFYQLEQRWAGSAFWREMQEVESRAS